MSRRQRYFTPNIPDRQFDEMVDALKTQLGYSKDSDLFSRAIAQLYNETMAKKRKLKL